MAVTVLIVGIVIFYYYLGIGFGNAVINTANGLRDAAQEWSQDNINPVDTIGAKIKEVVKDSAK